MTPHLGLVAEFSTGPALIAGVRAARDAGMSRFDSFTPYEVEGLQEALGIRRSRLPWLVFGAALFGAAAAYALQWWINVVAYPWNIAGRPLHSAPAFIPIAFEMAVLAAASTGFVSALVLGGLPSLWHPVFEIDGIASATKDRFWLGIDSNDSNLDRAIATAALEAAGALRVVWLGDAP